MVAQLWGGLEVCGRMPSGQAGHPPGSPGWVRIDCLKAVATKAGAVDQERSFEKAQPREKPIPAAAISFQLGVNET